MPASLPISAPTDDKNMGRAVWAAAGAMDQVPVTLVVWWALACAAVLASSVAPTAVALTTSARLANR
ncbi:hypothetical protein [Streptomyces sp. UNOB3_S3]|uniref:hypothetical protein n=1 Tax=Streptomyces sp. UNOB3_S3 TaxID=2871682 RepID=UPI001E558A4C|nr:hypothetical protein [Streptomyces sp. UNOB3_S3]MCC3773800.1 hypothetical protein [Streptomyces sp. UNOB3_S3]